MLMKAAVANLVVFRRSIRPHSAVAFMVEYLCFILDLLKEDKDLAKLFGIICACDTFIITLVDVVSKLKESSEISEEHGCMHWLYCPNCWRNFDVYLIILCMLHVAGSTVSYMFHSPYLVLVTLVLTALELVPENSYMVFKVFQDNGERNSTPAVEFTIQAPTHVLVEENLDDRPASMPHLADSSLGGIHEASFISNACQILDQAHSELQACETHIAQLRMSMGDVGEPSMFHGDIREVDVQDRVMPNFINLLLSQHQNLDHIQDQMHKIISGIRTLRGSIVDAYLRKSGE